MNTGKTSLIYLLFWALIPSVRLCAAEPSVWKDVRSLSMGSVYAPASSYLNPSALSLSPENALICAYENRFFVKELSTLTACWQQPNRWLDFSVLVNYFGYELYRETRCGINVSKVLKPGLSVGVRIYYFHLQYADNKDKVQVVSGDIGLQYQPVDNLRIGMVIYNPFRVSYKQYGEEYDLPVTMEIGAEYAFTEACSGLFGVEKDTRYPVCFKAALSYEIARFMELRIGMLTSPWMPTGGIGLRFDVFRVDVALNYHTSLGISPAVSICYCF